MKLIFYLHTSATHQFRCKNMSFSYFFLP